MYLPNSVDALVPIEKIIDYLLDLEHRDGGPKAEFFLGRGFTPENWQEFPSALKQHALEHEVAAVDVDARRGTIYTVDGELQTPGGTRPHVRVIWVVRHGETVPRLISAYPISRRRSNARTR